MPVVISDPFKYLGKSYGKESGYQCVAFVRGISSLPPTNSWQPGLKVWSPPGKIGCSLSALVRFGSIVATFQNRKYPNAKQHVGVFLEYVPGGFLMLDQYSTRPKVDRSLIVKHDDGYFDPARYYLVETA